MNWYMGNTNIDSVSHEHNYACIAWVTGCTAVQSMADLCHSLMGRM